MRLVTESEKWSLVDEMMDVYFEAQDNNERPVAFELTVKEFDFLKAEVGGVCTFSGLLDVSKSSRPTFNGVPIRIIDDSDESDTEDSEPIRVVTETSWPARHLWPAPLPAKKSETASIKKKKAVYVRPSSQYYSDRNIEKIF